MEYAACNVVYVDRAAKQDRLVKREDVIPSASPIDIPGQDDVQAHSRVHSVTLEKNLKTLLATFSEGMSTIASTLRRANLRSTPLYFRQGLRIKTL